MKQKIIQIIGVCYVAFALVMASSGTTAPLDCKNNQSRQESKLDSETTRFNGLGESSTRCISTKTKTKENRPIPTRGNVSQKISATTVASIVQADRAITNQKPNCLVLWTMKGCPPCKRMKEKAAKLQSQGYTIYYLPYEENKSLARRQGIVVFPTSIIYFNSKEVKRFTGDIDVELILKHLRKNEAPDYGTW